MRLSKITISGFKSFADTTEFVFDAPVIGIVGPNGCGKSNVVDAIKWVLGERSAKSLRGEAMLDVIFAGSAVRKPLGAASVTLTFENPIINNTASNLDAKRFLAIDSNEVAVTRKIYRDGRSEYLINNNKVRLKDVKELFLDTGIGTNAYSIIEQGRVAAILNANPTERRGILEEAAGVARFKTRRKEAERKLERSEINLVRVREQLANTERRLRTVKGQAEKARKFNSLNTRFQFLRKHVTLDTYHELNNQLMGLTSASESLESERKEIASQIVDLEDSKRDCEVQRHNLHTTHQTLIQRSTQYEASAVHSQQLIDMLERKIEDYREQLATERSTLAELKSKEVAQGGRREDAAEDIAASAEKMADIEREIDVIAEKYTQSQQTPIMLTETLATIQDNIEVKSVEQSQCHAIAGSAKERLSNLNTQNKKASEQQEKANNELAAHAQLTAATHKKLNEVRLIVQQHESALSAHDRAAHALGEQAKNLATELEELRQKRAASGSRLHLLQEMQQAREGLTDAVKHILDNSDSFPQIRGLLGDFIDANHADAHLVEIALGTNIQLLLIDKQDSVEAVEASLEDISGRVGLIAPAISGIVCSGLQANQATPILSLIQISPVAKEVISNLLCNTAVTSNLEMARSLQREHPQWRFVTKHGEILEVDGRIFVGKTTAGDQKGWLTRKIESNALTIEVKVLDQQIEQFQTQLSDLLHESEQAKQQQRESTVLIKKARNEEVEAKHQLQRIQSDIERCKRLVTITQNEIDELSKLISYSESQLSEAEEKIIAIDSTIEAITAERQEKRDALDKATAYSQEMSERLTAIRIELGKASEKHESNRSELRHIDGSMAELKRQHQLIQDQITRRLSQLEQAEASRTDSQEEVQKCKTNLQDCQDELDAFNENVTKANDAVESASMRLNAARSKGAIIDKRWMSIETSKREAEIKRETVEERAIEDLEIDISMQYNTWKERASENDRPAENREEMDEEAKELRDEIKKLGNVNIDAIEEEKNLEAQNVDLEKQVIDIDASATSLKTLIEELEEVSKTRFEETFNKIREHFSSPQGMFRQLFGGGSADIIMLPDEEGNVDLLEAGIEIKAKPPGKQPRVISQLSGGEQAMTAVALLLSIFKAKPSPFCVLDEVDAALDEANTHRFARSIHHFLDNSHFIVITHHKRTMMECNKLYGVTMQERGVSKHVAVSIDEVNNDGEFTMSNQKNNDELPTIEVPQSEATKQTV